MILSVLNIVSILLLFTTSDVTAWPLILKTGPNLVSVPCTFSRWTNCREKKLLTVCHLISDCTSYIGSEEAMVCNFGRCNTFLIYNPQMSSCVVVWSLWTCPMLQDVCLWRTVTVGELLCSSLVLTMSWFVTGMTQTTASVTRATAATPDGSVTRRGSARGWQNARTGHASAEVNTDMKKSSDL